MLKNKLFSGKIYTAGTNSTQMLVATVATNLISVPSLIYVNPITRKQFRYKIPGLAVDIKVIGAFCLPNLICFLLAWRRNQCALSTGIVFRSRRSYGHKAMSKGIDDATSFTMKKPKIE